MRFEWDALKEAKNREKHRVSFEEACTIFADRAVLTIHDEAHSASEDRWVSMGMSVVGRIVVVSPTWLESDPSDSSGEVVRIISARRANKREQAVYEVRR